MQFITLGRNLISNIENWANRSMVHKIVFCLCLSWFYALCSQCLIPLPLNLVPVTLQSVMFLFCAWIFGFNSVGAYFMYIAQGLCGAPFFSRLGSGLGHLLGPTGGYLIGFGVAMLMMAAMRDFKQSSKIWLLISYWFCCILYYVFGLLQLSCFVPSGKVLALGLYPFILGDFVIKAILILILTTVFQRRQL
jgi:biotin transport system substrate-specific component